MSNIEMIEFAVLFEFCVWTRSLNCYPVHKTYSLVELIYENMFAYYAVALATLFYVKCS